MRGEEGLTIKGRECSKEVTINTHAPPKTSHRRTRIRARRKNAQRVSVWGKHKRELVKTNVSEVLYEKSTLTYTVWQEGEFPQKRIHHNKAGWTNTAFKERGEGAKNKKRTSETKVMSQVQRGEFTKRE